MLNKYNICAELMVLANLCYNQGRKKDAVKLFVKAMDEEDSNELIQSLDDINAETTRLQRKLRLKKQKKCFLTVKLMKSWKM